MAATLIAVIDEIELTPQVALQHLTNATNYLSHFVLFKMGMAEYFV